MARLISRSIPKFGFYADIDVVLEDNESVFECVQNLRKELNPLHVHVMVSDMDGPAGYPELRLTSLNRRVIS